MKGRKEEGDLRAARDTITSRDRNNRGIFFDLQSILVTCTTFEPPSILIESSQKRVESRLVLSIWFLFRV